MNLLYLLTIILYYYYYLRSNSCASCCCFEVRKPRVYKTYFFAHKQMFVLQPSISGGPASTGPGSVSYKHYARTERVKKKRQTLRITTTITTTKTTLTYDDFKAINTYLLPFSVGSDVDLKRGFLKRNKQQKQC